MNEVVTVALRRGRLGAQTEEGQELREVDEPLGFCPFRFAQLAAILTIQELLEAMIECLGKPESVQLVWPG